MTEDVKKLLANAKVPLGNGNGDIGSKPVFTKYDIMFNGVGIDSHETACVSKDASSFEFCKTARKPYDSVVVEFYKLIRKHAPSTVLSSDGGDEVFGGQAETKPFDDKLTVFQDIETILFDKYRLRSDDAAAASFEIIKIVCKHLSK